jgi:hypothetical protein
MRLRVIPFIGGALLTCIAGTPVAADDGEQTLKRMTGGNIDNQLNVLPEDVGLHVSEADHAFTDTMKFYVPAQEASGAMANGTGSIVYNDVDGNFVEELPAAKPLINVFIYGPAFEVPDTAFDHSFMETFAAVSLDDGVTWKTTNLSESADQTSFTLGQSGGGGGGGHSDSEDPHGGVTHMLVLESAVWQDLNNNKNYGKLAVAGLAEPGDRVQIINYTVSGDVLFQTLAKNTDGTFDAEKNVRIEEAPCMVQAVVNGFYSKPLTVEYPEGTTVDCSGVDLTEYPGGVYNVFHATDGNKTLVAWPSRFCQQGQPAYSFAYDADPEEDSNDPQVLKRNAIAEYLGIDVTQDLYLTDLFEVAGSQGSINFAEEGYPQAGEVPFGCVWTARGVLRAGDDPRTAETEASHMVWTKPERLTSGRRDPNRIEVQAVKGAGFVITWQEDPDGLRPGQGLGPGEGWSGAVAHDKTDVWYSFIPWEYFDIVEVDDNTGDGVPDPINIADHDLEVSGRPQVYVPMAVPMRLTNNNKCNAEYNDPGITDPSDNKYFSYCNHVVAQDYGLQNFCANTVDIPQGPQGTPGPICVNEDGLPNVANTGATRPRLSLQGYDSDADDLIDSAWVIVATEESKGLGRFQFLPDGTPCDEDAPDASPDCTSDIGKNQWYFSFDMGGPATSITAGKPYGLVQNLVNQGNMLNQPEADWRTGEFYPAINTLQMWDFDTYNFDLYNTEIARRSSLLVQGIAKASGSIGKLVAMPSWKQGAMRQGGPADTMLRRIVLPAGYVEGIDNNPYAFTNMECLNVDGTTSGWILQDGSNPFYPDGICMAPATNLSGVVPDTCLDTSTDQPITCPTVTFDGSTYGIGDTNPILQGYIQGEGNTMKVLTWHQCPSDGEAQDTTELEGEYFNCDTDNRTDDYVNLRDQSWYNPLDVSKGHRGFLDGDFVMFLYAWSPNWRLNAVGNDRYELYVRRSFDGGSTWTTLPEGFESSVIDETTMQPVVYNGGGTVTCETYRSTVTQTQQAPEPHVCYDYPPGGNEQARNVTQHSRMRVTTLDPRYAMTGSPRGVSITADCVDTSDPTIDTTVMTCDDMSDMDSDLRDPSRYFMVYETGDNSTVEAGEAEPLDLFYSRAENFGDNYVVWAETDSDTADASLCYPSDPHGDEGVIGTVIEESGFCNEFDRMNAGGDTHASEANLEANSDGSKLYGVWAQWVFENDDYEGEIIESNAMARRIWWIDDFISDNPDNVWTLPGTNQPTQ